MLTIDAAILDAIVAHARRDHPDEACGIVAGTVGTRRCRRGTSPMENAARSMTFYEFDSTEYLRVWREMDDLDEEPVVIYHSHTATEAYPSRTDISYAGWPEAHYLLVSTRDPDITEVRSFRIVDGDGDRGAGPAGECDGGFHGGAVLPVRADPASVDYECRA